MSRQKPVESELCVGEWQSDEWTPCENGLQSRSVICVSGGSTIPIEGCPTRVASRICGQEPEWGPVTYGLCNPSTGIRTGQATCFDEHENILSNSECTDDLEEDCTGQFVASGFEPCENGERTQNVICRTPDGILLDEAIWDLRCDGDEPPTTEECHETNCNNGVDDDDDGAVDCDDSECELDVACLVEICGNHMDDDHDSLIDCYDDDCYGDPACTGQETCDNGVDDDGDGDTDCDDSDCDMHVECVQVDCVDRLIHFVSVNGNCDDRDLNSEGTCEETVSIASQREPVLPHVLVLFTDLRVDWWPLV
eukprot:TRINITY_DN5267_c0_g1_i2.p1 TRINITY_DN5267_c0_g1~~TRINITY_DN5267_c0_g1_i2.p1  ORF type:complete len:309 (+),score=78.16 TRINITY_DN5267_c0_g1_i2:187-1113(+)